MSGGIYFNYPEAPTMMRSRSAQELKEHIEAFEIFFSTSGGSATQAAELAVCKHFQICRRTFWNWYSKFQWKQRSFDRREEMKIEFAAHVKERILKSRMELLVITDTAIDKFDGNLREDKVKVENVADYEKLVKLHQLLLNERTGDETVINIVTAIPRPVIPNTMDTHNPLSIDSTVTEVGDDDAETTL